MPTARKKGPAPDSVLAEAFHSFTTAAGSLEAFYSSLQAEVRRLRHELDEANRELRQEREAARRVQALAEMSALLAHEIRNPLGSLELFAGLLAESVDADSDARSWADQLQAGLRALAATVNNVLQFHSPAGAGRVPVDPVELLEETIVFLEPLARQWWAEVRLRPTGAGRILAEPHGLRQVFLNLAINAFKAMPTGGLLEIHAGPAPEAGRFEVHFVDAGVGIAPADRERIFEAGFTTSPNGSGLGLAVCRKIVEAHGGRIRAESAPGPGAAFILSFPVIGESQ